MPKQSKAEAQSLAIIAEFDQEHHAMAGEIHKLRMRAKGYRAALGAIKECGSKGQAMRIAIQGLSDSTTK